jgi:hypothetical protein
MLSPLSQGKACTVTIVLHRQSMDSFLIRFACDHKRELKGIKESAS